jgi:aryl-alcohol dehydrogenase-like predicted oxidoreductase
MSIERIEIAPGFSISRIIKGGWQLSQGHSTDNTRTALEDMALFVENGVTTFDCADIYTGVEELIGKFLKQHRISSNYIPVQVLTKFVPDYDSLFTLSKTYVEKVIDRSLQRLGVEQLDMVQFSWWNYSVPRWVETAGWLNDLRLKGKINLISGTNFNTQATEAILRSRVPVSTLQVQYSLLDHRPEKSLVEICSKNNIHLLCYGTVAGGFLSERWLNTDEPIPPYENRSLVKYKLMIEEFGGWYLFQELLCTLKQIADNHKVSITNIASRYILEKTQVGGVIIGTRHANHLGENKNVFSFKLTTQDHEDIQRVISQRKGPAGDVFDLERIKDGPHGSIMRYNLNQVDH